MKNGPSAAGPLEYFVQHGVETNLRDRLYPYGWKRPMNAEPSAELESLK